jgi:hypothetical protein
MSNMRQRLGYGVRVARVCTLLLAIGAAAAQSPKPEPQVPTAPTADAQEKVFRDSNYGVSFKVPKGWDLFRKDGETSTFHMDARSAPRNAMLRAVATIGFNPYPRTTLSGAMFYYSVAPHATEAECVQQASARQKDGNQERRQTQDIAGMNFTHGHDEYGTICVESRDEIYTTFRHGSCYRFDLTVNTFCSVSSGVRDMRREEMLAVEQKLANILSTVELSWEKSGPHPVPVPEMEPPAPSRVPMKVPSEKATPPAGSR